VKPIRVLVVDDSVVVRRVLSELLQSGGDIEVAGTAPNAPIALQKIPLLWPDVVLLDVEMPEMDGIEAVKRIRASWPRLPVVMCSTLTERGADITLRALAAGATDYVAKPSAVGARGEGLGLLPFRDHLLATVRALAPVAVSPAAQPEVDDAPPPSTRIAPRLRRTTLLGESITAVGIGCSTGGPHALGALFESMPGDLPVPIFIVQHMPPLFTKLLADRLCSSSKVRVSEAVHGELVEPGRAYVAPGSSHMVVVRDGARQRVQLNQDPPENSCRPAVDVLFRSLSQVYGAGTLAAVLTGMGQDGARGASRIVEVGGRVIVQDPASCVVASMPSAVLALGIADGELPIERLGQEIVTRVRRSIARGVAGTPRRMEA